MFAVTAVFAAAYEKKGKHNGNETTAVADFV